MGSQPTNSHFTLNEQTLCGTNISLLGNNRFIQIGNGLHMTYDPGFFGNWSRDLTIGPRFGGLNKQPIHVPPKRTETASIQVTPRSIVINRMNNIQINPTSIGNPQVTIRLPLNNFKSTTQLIQQVSLTDFFRPDIEHAGSIVLILRHPSDMIGEANTLTQAGRDPDVILEGLRNLFNACTAPWTVGEGGGLRAYVTSLSFIAACRAEEYTDKQAADANRTAIVSAYGCSRMETRLIRFSECLRAMVQCHVFPHRFISFFGSLLEYTIQDNLCNITAVAKGPQEAARTDKTSTRRVTANIPACVFWDVDKDLHLSADGLKHVFLVFVYTQRRQREGVRLHLALSQLNEQCFGRGIGFLLGRIRAENAAWGTEGVANTHQPYNTRALPLVQLSNDPTSPRCSIGEITGVNWNLARQRLYQWTGDFRGLPTQLSCMYAAYTLIGTIPSESVRYTRRMERFGGYNVPTIWLEGVVWGGTNTWNECYY